MEKIMCKNYCYMAANCPAGRNCFVRNYIALGGERKFLEFVERTIIEFNRLNIPEVPKVLELAPIDGRKFNFSYTLPNNSYAKLLDDDSTYLGAVIIQDIVTYCFIAGADFLLISSFIEDCTEPEIVMFKRR